MVKFKRLRKLLAGLICIGLVTSGLTVYAEEDFATDENVSVAIRVGSGGSSRVVVGEESYDIPSGESLELVTEKGSDVEISMSPWEYFEVSGVNVMSEDGEVIKYYDQSKLKETDNVVSIKADSNIICDVTFNDAFETADSSANTEDQAVEGAEDDSSKPQETPVDDMVLLNNPDGGIATVEDLDVQGWKLLTVQAEEGKLIEDVLLSDSNMVYYIFDSKADGTYCKFAFREPVSPVTVDITYVDSYSELPLSSFGNAYSPDKDSFVDIYKDTEELSKSSILYGSIDDIQTQEDAENLRENQKISEGAVQSSLDEEDRVLDEAVPYTRGNVKFVTGARISYEGHVTHWMWGDDVICYCARPNAPTPPSGTYYMDQYWDRGTFFSRMLYNLYGGKNFAAGGTQALFIQYGWDTPEEQYAYSHIAAAVLCNNNAAVESGNFNRYSFSSSCWTGMTNTSVENVLNILRHILAKFPAGTGTPVGSYAYMIAEKTKYQAVLGGWTPDSGSVKVQKSSTNPGLTNNNGNYSLAGAVYTVYRDAGLANIAGTLTTDDSGNTGTLTLESGTYYVKETSAPKGFNLDPQTYTANIQAGQTFTVYSSDSPKMGSVEVIKSSANTSITNNNSNYSLKGAIYGVYSDNNCYNEVGRITTDVNGWGRLDNLSGGRYYIKEIKASPGYNLDTNVYPVDCTV